MLDLGQLRSFAHVAERGTVAAAAEALGYTPPAVSQHIAKLVAELGVSLFDRVGGRLVPTDAGCSLRPLALDMLDREAGIRVALSETPERRRFVIAGFASAISSVVVPQLANLHLEMDIELIEVEDADAIRELTLGTVDLVLAQEYEGHETDRDPRFEYVPLLVDELKLVLSTGRSPTTRVADLADEPWLLNGIDTRCSRAIERVLETHGIQPQISGTVGDNTTLLELVRHGHGVSVVPSSVLAEHPGVVVSTEVLGVRRTIFGLVRAAVRRDAQTLIDLLRLGQTGADSA